MTEIWRTIEPRPGLKCHYRLSPNRRGRLVIDSVTLEGDAITGEDFRRLRITDMEAQPVPELPRPIEPLTRPAGGDRDPHRQLTAAWYRYYATFSPNPGKRMADDSGVPLPTVHNWIREARLRGFLPMAQRGKAG